MLNTLLFWLTVIFATNVLLIAIFWNIYGGKIQFLITRKDEKELILDQLRREALELKLPKEHSPRI